MFSRRDAEPQRTQRMNWCNSGSSVRKWGGLACLSFFEKESHRRKPPRRGFTHQALYNICTHAQGGWKALRLSQPVLVIDDPCRWLNRLISFFRSRAQEGTHVPDCEKPRRGDTCPARGGSCEKRWSHGTRDDPLRSVGMCYCVGPNRVNPAKTMTTRKWIF
jgi:hypothetical protein